MITKTKGTVANSSHLIWKYLQQQQQGQETGNQCHDPLCEVANVGSSGCTLPGPYESLASVFAVNDFGHTTPGKAHSLARLT